MQGKIFTIGSGGMEEISVPANHEKNMLLPGRILQLNGYANPRYVIVKNMGVNPSYPHYGAKYLCVHLEDFTFKQSNASDFDHISKKENGRIHMYLTDDTLSAEETADAHRKAEKEEQKKKAQAEQAEQLAQEQEQKGRELFAKYIPDDTVALIIAELETDDCELQTDYFSTKISGKVILGFSKHRRDLFSEMRKHAHKIPETEHLAVKAILDSNGREKTDKNKSYWTAADEHREKYSMGAGYYLKTTGRYSTGWRISKQVKYGDDWGRDDYISIAKRCVFEDKDKKAPDATESTESTSPPVDAPESEKIQPEMTQEVQVESKEVVTIGNYKGHPTISLPMGGGRDFKFGLSKAKAILEYVDEIRDFVGDNG